MLIEITTLFHGEYEKYWINPNYIQMIEEMTPHSGTLECTAKEMENKYIIYIDQCPRIQWVIRPSLEALLNEIERHSRPSWEAK